MTYKEFLESDRTLDDWIGELVRAEFAKQMADLPVEATLDAIRADTAAAEQQVAESEFNRVVLHQAVLHGVIASAVRFLVPDVRRLFELRDGILSPRNGETLPGDPLTPLTFEAWLAEQRKELPFFVKS